MKLNLLLVINTVDIILLIKFSENINLISLIPIIIILLFAGGITALGITGVADGYKVSKYIYFTLFVDMALLPLYL